MTFKTTWLPIILFLVIGYLPTFAEATNRCSVLVEGQSSETVQTPSVSWLQRKWDDLKYRSGILPASVKWLTLPKDQIDKDLIEWANRTLSEVAVWEAYDSAGNLLAAYGEQGRLFSVSVWPKFRKLVEKLKENNVEFSTVKTIRFRHVHPLPGSFSIADKRISFEAKALMELYGFKNADLEMGLLVVPDKGSEWTKETYVIPASATLANWGFPLRASLRKRFNEITQGKGTLESLFPKEKKKDILEI